MSESCRTDPEYPFLMLRSKEAILREWERAKAEMLRPDDVSLADAAGRGWVDPEIVPLCDELNKLYGIVTLQSCCGHVRPSEEDPEVSHHWNGQLWVWASPYVTEHIRVPIRTLGTHPLFDYVAMRYHSSGRQFFELSFAGLNRGEEAFEESCAAIRRLFTGPHRED